MRRTLLLTIASLGLTLSGVGCGSKSSGGGAVATTPADPGVTVTVVDPNTQCNPWQLYSSQYGCLDPHPNCPSGQGIDSSGNCRTGTSASTVPEGIWKNGLTVTNVSMFRKMLQDMGRCYQSQCPNGSWAYMTLQVFESTYTGVANTGNPGLQNLIPGYNQSSAFHWQYGYNYGAPQSRTARVTLYTSSYFSYATNFQFTTSTYPTQNGFKMVVYGVAHSAAYNERIVFNFKFVDAARTQLAAEMIYKGQVIATGTIVK